MKSKKMTRCEYRHCFRRSSADIAGKLFSTSFYREIFTLPYDKSFLEENILFMLEHSYLSNAHEGRSEF